jgi:hypothetical protein
LSPRRTRRTAVSPRKTKKHSKGLDNCGHIEGLVFQNFFGSIRVPGAT